MQRLQAGSRVALEPGIPCWGSKMARSASRRSLTVSCSKRQSKHLHLSARPCIYRVTYVMPTTEVLVRHHRGFAMHEACLGAFLSIYLPANTLHLLSPAQGDPQWTLTQDFKLARHIAWDCQLKELRKRLTMQGWEI